MYWRSDVAKLDSHSRRLLSRNHAALAIVRKNARGQTAAAAELRKSDLDSANLRSGGGFQLSTFAQQSDATATEEDGMDWTDGRTDGRTDGETAKA